MKPRNWFFDGTVFVSPTFKQNGKPYLINSEIKQAWFNSLPKPRTLSEKILDWLVSIKKTQTQSQTTETPDNEKVNDIEEESEEEKEDSQGDGLMMGDSMFPEEF